MAKGGWHLTVTKELLIVANPVPGSRLAYLMRVPLGEGLVLRTSATWPRTNALYCHPVPLDEWPETAEVIERVPLRACARRGAAIDLVAARSRENRSQLVFTQVRGRDAVFWQSPRTRRQARPAVGLPNARAAGIKELEITVDAHERYPYRFANQQVRTVRRALPCGDYGLILAGALVAVVERKSLADLLSSLTSGRLRYALGELATVPRAAVVVEDRYSRLFKQEWVRPSLVADGIAECQIRWPTIPIVFCETRSLAEEWTRHYLALAQAWATAEPAAIERIGAHVMPERPVRDGDGPTPAEIRAWAGARGLPIAPRGRIPVSIRQAWELARGSPEAGDLARSEAQVRSARELM